MRIQLSKEDTYKLLYLQIKKATKPRNKVTTKFEWFCLSCMKPIYIRHDSCSLHCIYCKDCYSKNQANNSIIEQQYLRVLKEKQIQQINTICT